jgi:hypothetical protein
LHNELLVSFGFLLHGCPNKQVSSGASLRDFSRFGYGSVSTSNLLFGEKEGQF